MPQRKCAKDELIKNRKRHLHNLDIKTAIKKSIKKFLVTVQEKKIDEAKELLKQLYKRFDKAAKRHLIHKNTAARRKSYYTRLLNSTH